VGRLPMKTTHTNEWMLLTAYTLFGIVALSLFYFIFYSTVSTADDVHYTFKNVFPYSGEVVPVFTNDTGTVVTEAVNSDAIETADKVITMAIHRARDIGDTVVIYRGLEGSDTFRVDVMIPELDPEVIYPYWFDIQDAKKGFRLAERRFKLLSARKSYLHFQAVGR